MYEVISIHPMVLQLQLFAEGGDGAAAGDTGAAGTKGVTEGAANPQGQVQVTDADGTTATVPDRKAEFEKLIKGEYKELYDERMQDTVRKRLKGTNEIVQKYEALAPTLEILMKKYGVDAGDIEALNKAIEEDDSYYEEEALEKGISVQELKRIRKIEKENSALKKQMDEQAAKENASKLYASWLKQGDETKAIYPAFNFDAEMQNPKFTDLLRIPGVDVRTAYELIHKDEIIAGAMQFAAKTAEKKVTDRIAANGARPSENGMSSQSASITGSDVSQLSKEQLFDIQKRVARGERVDLTRR